jgi:hypothetical protein
MLKDTFERMTDVESVVQALQEAEVLQSADPHFYNMLVSEWQTTSAWTGLTWQQYKAELRRTRGLNVMSFAEYHSASQMGVFPFYH